MTFQDASAAKESAAAPAATAWSATELGALRTRLMQAYAQGDAAGLGDDDAKDEGSAPR